LLSYPVNTQTQTDKQTDCLNHITSPCQKL